MMFSRQRTGARRRTAARGTRVFGAILCLHVALFGGHALAQDGSFVVSDMRVEGLQRISEGTVFNYLPINIGDRVDQLRVQEAIRALYDQKLFDNIEMRRDGQTLIIAVRERPSIEDFTIDGNKDIKTEDLMDSLRGVGLARGRTFDRSVLDNVAMFLREQYYDRGKYGVVIDTNVEDRPNNTVRIGIDVKEGDRARIRQVNVVGNQSFSDEEVRTDFELDTANWLSWFRQDDRYAKESLSGDLEKLRSYYMDRGFADFRVDSTQVAISPDRKDIYVTINVHEGERYKISGVKLVGDMVIPEEFLQRMVLTKPGDIFNLQALTSSAELMSFRLGEEDTRTPISNRCRSSITTRRKSRSPFLSIRKAAFTCGASTSTVWTRSTTRSCDVRCASSKVPTSPTGWSIDRRFACSDCPMSSPLRSRPSRCLAVPTSSMSISTSNTECLDSSAAALATLSLSA